MEQVSLYQLSISILLIGWLVALVAVWVRYDGFPHRKYILIAVLIWPFLLVDEWLRLSGYFASFHFLIGSFQFITPIVAATLVLCVRSVTQEKSASTTLWFFLPAVLLFAGQLPFILMTESFKISALLLPPTGDVLTNWPYLATYLFSAFVMLSYAVHGAEYLSSYHYYLSDQVVDIDMYELKITLNGCYVLVFTAFLNMLIIGLVIFDLQPFEQWQQVINITNAGAFLFFILILLDRRRYSPMPFAEKQFSRKRFSDDYLRHVLKQAEQAIIEHKAYKRKGLRIRQIADAINVEPAALALATRFVLKRNFRAFVYHYRLEYAKKVLMRTDQKVTTVAKRLGFNSEKYLSNMFVKYIRMMGEKEAEEDSAKQTSKP